ncbi:uncharacterized protein TRIVIDRAFT_67758 [Trichoderma virens Gv29-8]|uniref:Uncharacterized protein n=1 Tax=Hypocrea virens (strain Gv29-8 / FGSC 10586) TaxID=413071 RepID=G9MQR8_HYPVG|nr:uncharacterized protein TRIVIDRAFT_67758 [Trichoderma virens Gv29-8]EHK24135.1 hypothetical protein TRIVIDRAFT_67758 [Trichoderma virens Gv29-8]
MDQANVSSPEPSDWQLRLASGLWQGAETRCQFAISTSRRLLGCAGHSSYGVTMWRHQRVSEDVSEAHRLVIFLSSSLIPVLLLSRFRFQPLGVAAATPSPTPRPASRAWSQWRLCSSPIQHDQACEHLRVLVSADTLPLLIRRAAHRVGG